MAVTTGATVATMPVQAVTDVTVASTAVEAATKNERFLITALRPIRLVDHPPAWGFSPSLLKFTCKRASTRRLMLSRRAREATRPSARLRAGHPKNQEPASSKRIDLSRSRLTGVGSSVASEVNSAGFPAAARSCGGGGQALPERVGEAAVVEREPEGPTRRTSFTRRPTAPSSPRRGLLGSPSVQRRLMSTSWAVGAVLLVALACAALSAVLSGLQSPRHTASALVLVRQDPPLLDSAPTFSADASDRFVQSQVVALESLVKTLPGQPGSGRAGPNVSVREAGQVDGSDVTVRQSGLTDVVEITATAGSSDDAVKAANQLLNAFAQLRRQQITDHANTTADEASKQLDTVMQALQSSQGTGNSATTGAATALTTEYGRLLSLIDQIHLEAANAQPTSVIRDASPADVSQQSNTKSNALLAGLLGGLAATAVLLGLRRMSERSRRQSVFSTARP